MNVRMELHRIDGLEEQLTRVLPTPLSRMIEPDEETLGKVALIGNAFIHEAAEQPEHAEHTIYTAYQWPERGPAIMAMVWAINVRSPEERKTSHPFFWRLFTETKDTTNTLLSRHEMEQDLARYAVQTFGTPRAVEEV